MTGAWGDDMADLSCDEAEQPEQRMHTREIFRRGGRYVMCQVMNWQDGPPPKYLLCNPLSGYGAGQLFLAHQGLGTWMEADLYSVANQLNERPRECQYCGRTVDCDCYGYLV